MSFITDPEKIEWKMKDNVYKTVLTNLVFVPDINVELSFCSCQTVCKSLHSGLI